MTRVVRCFVVLFAPLACADWLFGDDFHPLGDSGGPGGETPVVVCESDAECVNDAICTHDPHGDRTKLTCVNDGCTLSSDCGGTCYLGLDDVGECVDTGPYPCESSADCGAGYPPVCVAGFCRECGADADCGTGALCLQIPPLPAGAKHCARACTTDEQCRRGCCRPHVSGPLVCAPVDDCQ